MFDGKQVPRKLVGSDDERAVSPVIGVILMVAITVILAAVIAAFVLDMGPSEPEPTAAISIDDEGTNEASVTLESINEGDGIAVFEEGSTSNNAIVTVSGDSASLGDELTAADSTFHVVSFSGELESSDIDSASDIDALAETDGVTISVEDSFEGSS
ncbi:type IV pilin [Halopiger goleimassiliensis]|uniref:type IV pilin n=1 Tax=Halopiger goleimassiliensis TaxID=1293048 RepID=UPI00067789CE|nr:type IV pilin N-terminal domain-containing protein [Halopiger goleimassiliensis]